MFNRVLFCLVGMTWWLGVGCSPNPASLAPATVSAVAPTQVRPTEPATPTLLPTVTPVVPIETVLALTPMISQTLVTPTVRRVVPTPTRAIPPGVYVTNLRINPDPPKRATELHFYVTFLNTLPTPQTYKWLVYIYRTDTPNRSTSETTAHQSIIAGEGEHLSDGYWRLGPGGPCEPFFARVAYFNDENKAILFTQPDGRVFEKKFDVCP